LHKFICKLLRSKVRKEGYKRESDFVSYLLIEQKYRCQRYLPLQKLLFIFLVPLDLILMVSFSCIKNPDLKTVQNKQSGNANQSQLKIGKIIWKGNTVYDNQ
jgi:hypothetical protein